MNKRFENKVALVTGAGRGIGEAAAKAFAAEGASVMVVDFNEDAAGGVAEAIRQVGGKASSCRADATNEDDVAAMVRKTVEKFGGLHAAANLVGINHPEATGPMLHTQSLEGWQATIAGSMTSTFLSCKYEIAHMIEHGGGSIVNTSSVAGARYIPLGGAAYTSAKAGVVHFSRFAAVTYAPHNIRVNCLSPGFTMTPVYMSASQAYYPDLPPKDALDKFVSEAVACQPIKRAVETEEQAHAILWLSSSEAAMVTGHTLSVDGGWTVA